MIALSFFFAFLVSITNAAICDVTLSDDITALFADYPQYTDERPPASFSIGLNPDEAKQNIESYLAAIKAYLTAAPLSDATQAAIANEVASRWAGIRTTYLALSALDQAAVRTCIAVKADQILAIKNAKDAAAQTALQNGYNAYNKYATAINLALSKLDSAAGGTSATTLVAAQVAVQALRIAQRVLDFAAWLTDEEATVYAGFYDGVNKTALWFANDPKTCDTTCTANLESAITTSVMEVIYARIAYRRAVSLAAELQANWQALLDNLRALANQIQDKVNQEFPKAVQRLKDFVANNSGAWEDAVDQALEGLSCDVASASISVTFPLNQVSFQVSLLVCNATSKTQDQVNQLLCDRLIALVAGTGATGPAQFACVPTTTKRTTNSQINIVGTNSGSGLMATLTLLLVTLFFHLF